MNLLQKISLPFAFVLTASIALPSLAAPQSMAAKGMATDRIMAATDGSSGDMPDATAGGAADSQGKSDSGAPKTTKLQGGVSHAEELPGLSDGLRVGKVYSDDLLQGTAAQSDSEWFYIPAWYAGVRHAEDAMIISRYDFATGEETNPMLRQLNRQDSRAGYQLDKNGGIWDYKHVPMIQHIDAGFCDAILYLRSLVPISGSDDRLVFKYNEVSVSIDKRSKKILQVVQQEQINTVSCPLPGTLRIDISVKSFAPDGKPQRQEQSVMMAKITQPFEKIDELDGKDLRPLFRDYLIAHKLEKLLPPDLAKATP